MTSRLMRGQRMLWATPGKSRLLISRLKPHRGKGSSGAPVAADNFAYFFILWRGGATLPYLMYSDSESARLSFKSLKIICHVWSVKICGCIFTRLYFITVVTFSPFCTLVCLRSLCFRRMCFRGCLLFGGVFVRYVFTGIRRWHANCYTWQCVQHHAT